MISNGSLALVFSSRPIKMSPRFVLGRENVPCVAEVVNRSLKADCTDFTVKSVQSTLSHLWSPPEQMQSQRNYGSFLSKSHLHGMILLRILAQNRPKSKRQCFNRAICYFKIISVKQGEATAICLRSRVKC